MRWIVPIGITFRTRGITGVNHGAFMFSWNESSLSAGYWHYRLGGSRGFYQDGVCCRFPGKGVEILPFAANPLFNYKRCVFWQLFAPKIFWKNFRRTPSRTHHLIQTFPCLAPQRRWQGVSLLRRLQNVIMFHFKTYRNEWCSISHREWDSEFQNWAA